MTFDRAWRKLLAFPLWVLHVLILTTDFINDRLNLIHSRLLRVKDKYEMPF